MPAVVAVAEEIILRVQELLVLAVVVLVGQ
jgi:hypothetical protein